MKIKIYFNHFIISMIVIGIHFPSFISILNQIDMKKDNKRFTIFFFHIFMFEF